MQELIGAMADMQEDKVFALTKQYLAEGEDPVKIFRAYQAALEEVGRRFENKLYFIPELILSGEMMKAGSELIKPHMNVEEAKSGNPKLGKLLLATIEGDIHDIGKNIYAMLMEMNGFDVLDIGVDVPVDTIIAKAREFEPDIIGISGLLTLAFDPMKRAVDELANACLRDNAKIIVGGAQLDQQVCDHIGADAFATDAVLGVNQCKAWMAQK